MKLSSKGRYAVRALFDIAFWGQGKPAQVKEVAERQGIPPRFLEQIFQDLKRADLLAAKRGPKGGYTLTRDPGSIRLGDVVRALEGPIALSEEATHDAPKVARDSLRVIDSVFDEVGARVEACFDAVTLGDLCDRAAKLGVRRAAVGRLVYVI